MLKSTAPSRAAADPLYIMLGSPGLKRGIWKFSEFDGKEKNMKDRKKSGRI